MADLFADVKVGDVFFTQSIWAGLRKYPVTRVTEARFYSATSDSKESTFAKKDGYQVGEGLTRGLRTLALVATDDLVAEYEKQSQIERAKAVLHQAGDILRIAARDGGDDAIRLAALLPPELKGE